ncbi:MAG: hypothetical protein E5X67_29845 [Mesorhizobium sp.]|uniref:Z1 domain-containing protein n=1 Tax=Mesorhizobium sp. TaxID=1871066 RepID=UPI001226F4A6|nr:Z1 domain-containing protein [Mesorhizobium sp.]TIP24251.1 MAG: hypothetical protein E5X67_29845 [Mesorhizobium sp.]
MIIDAAQRELVQMSQLRLAQRPTGEPLTREEIAATVDRLLTAFPEWRDTTTRNAAISELSAIFSTFVGEASVLTADDGHVPWLDEHRELIEWRYWERYRSYLIGRRLPNSAINSLNRVTDRALGLLGNPAADPPFDRRGMVVGDVQSGKTGNYTGLICKAADAGYKVIIVLAGLNNNLRSQTQIRLDEGFVGKVSVPLGESTSRFVGVGAIDPSLLVDWATNRLERGDFNLRVMSQTGHHPGGRPFLLVVKKNNSVLQGVLNWIETTGNASDEHGRRFRGMPLLVIDDEADNASVDTRAQKFEAGIPDPKHKPTAINAKIRTILGRFDQAAYVGYTATPFANIFIHPDAETGKTFQDLFPRDFIINMPTPDNYVGAVRIFGRPSDDEDGEGEVEDGLPSLIIPISDHAASKERTEVFGWMPPRHGMEHVPLWQGEPMPPPSLRQALQSFALVVAARRVRGQGREHNSMLVHVTRLRAVQRRVQEQIQETMDELANMVRYGGSDGMESFQTLWEEKFTPVTAALSLEDCPALPWSEVEPALRATIQTIKVREINGSSADVLDYDATRDGGLNVVAIGGDKLARGLTLEGLSISYFLRGSTMYDTLMQMGRWFGYRPGYLDLCRLFTTADHVDWYGHIAQASEELRREFNRMEAIRATPRQFGLRVRSHPSLTVTSRAKMRHGTELNVAFAGDVSETTVFSLASRPLQDNLAAATDLIRRLSATAHHVPNPTQARDGDRIHRWEGSHLWTGSPPEAVLAFLDRFSTHEDAARANALILAKYIRRQVERAELTDWNVLLLGGDGNEPVDLGGQTVRAIVRQPKGGYYEDPEHKKILKIFGPKDRFVIRRLLNPRDEAVDLGAETYADALKETIAKPLKKRRPGAESPKQPSGVYLRSRRAPTTGLLLLYPLARRALIEHQNALLEHNFLDVPHNPIGMGISFPASSKAEAVTYIVNSIYGADDDDEGDA